MATITIDGKEITLPRYSLSIMSKAAPYLDNLQATLAEMTGSTIDDMTAGQANRLVMDTAGFLAAGTSRVDPALTFEKLCDTFTIADAQMLQGVVGEVLGELGISLAAKEPGEAAQAAAVPEVAEAVALAAE